MDYLSEICAYSPAGVYPMPQGITRAPWPYVVPSLPNPDNFDPLLSDYTLPDDFEASAISYTEDSDVDETEHQYPPPDASREVDEKEYQYPPPDAPREIGPYFIPGVTSSFQSAVAPGPVPETIPAVTRRAGRKRSTKQAVIKPTANRIAAIKNEARHTLKSRAPAPSPLVPASHCSQQWTNTPRSTFEQLGVSTSKQSEAFAPSSPPQSTTASHSIFKQPSNSAIFEQPDEPTSNQSNASTYPSTSHPTYASRSTFEQPNTSLLPPMIPSYPIAPPFEPLSYPAPRFRRSAIEHTALPTETALDPSLSDTRKRKSPDFNFAEPESKKPKHVSPSHPLQSTHASHPTFKQQQQGDPSGLLSLLPHMDSDSPLAPTLEPLFPPLPAQERSDSVGNVESSLLAVLDPRLGGLGDEDEAGV